MTNQKFEQYEAYYLRQHDFRDSKHLEPHELQRDRAPRWLRRLSKDAHILDYGCADGYMLWVLHTLGYRNLVGADIAESVLRHARARLNGTSVQLRHLESSPLDDCGGRFDAIIMNQVLEHVPREDVVPILKHLCSLLKPGGFISVGVPNAGSLLGGFTHAIDFTHLVPFTEYSLRQFLELAGFESTEIVAHPPRLFWPTKKPVRSLLRLMNRMRYELNRAMHIGLYTLRDPHPFPRCFEETVEMPAFRPRTEH